MACTDSPGSLVQLEAPGRGKVLTCPDPVCLSYNGLRRGEVAERFKAPVLKTDA